MAFIAERAQSAQATAPGGSPPSDDEGSFEASEAWSPETVHKLWNESEDPIRFVLWTLARHEGKPVAAEKLAELLGKEASTEGRRAISGMMGALGRRLKKRHDGLWPFSKKWNGILRRWEYEMPENVAKLFNSFVGALKLAPFGRTRPTPEVRASTGPESGFFGFIRCPLGRLCRITSVYPTEAEARTAADSWLDEAMAEPPYEVSGKAYAWVRDPAGHADMHVCVQVGTAVARARLLVN